MFNDHPIIIAASGASIPYDKEILSPLKEIIENNVSVGLNYFNYFGCNTTFASFVDENFYKLNEEWLIKLPLIIGKFDHQIKRAYENSILLPKSRAYMGKDSWDIKKEKCLYCNTKVDAKDKLKKCPKCNVKILCSIGFYHHHFVTLFALTLAIALEFKEIYILGLDGCAVNDKTHFYQDLVIDYKKFRGVGKNPKGYNTSTYNDVEKTNNWYAPYVDETDVKIYNVSTQSIIYHFPKITYEEFYNKIGQRSINQDESRKEIREFVHRKVNE